MFIHTYEKNSNWISSRKRAGCTDILYVAAFPLQSKQDTVELQSWCFESYGLPGYRHLTDEIRWNDDIKYGEIQFSRKEDLLMFVLRWS